MDASYDVPTLDCAYKLQEYGGRARRKRSEGKATWPGSKQVFRRYDGSGRMAGDVLALQSEHIAGEPLLRPVMRNGKRLADVETLEQARSRCHADLMRLPPALAALEPAPRPYPVTVSDALKGLAEACDREQATASDS
jgi:nicotinate phosphoribosyltransferase